MITVCLEHGLLPRPWFGTRRVINIDSDITTYLPYIIVVFLCDGEW